MGVNIESLWASAVVERQISGDELSQWSLSLRLCRREVFLHAIVYANSASLQILCQFYFSKHSQKEIFIF